ncbi:MAG: C40 family peptidase [Rhizobacter sp.]|nr:C40 family peptidase [Rhizobacter sp.]
MFAPGFRTSLQSALVAIACLGGAAAAQAAPEGRDVVAQLLVDRGVLDPHVFDVPGKAAGSAAALGRQVRDTTSGLVLSAMHFLGVPYKRGGESSDDGFDCSGFTRHVYESTLGLMLPRKVDQQAKAAGLAPVKRSDLQPGDLVFFNTLRRTFSHVGIYVGDGKFIHAPKPGGEVRLEDMGVRYWAKRFTGARRAPQASLAAAAAHPAAVSSPPATLAAEPGAPDPVNSTSP